MPTNELRKDPIIDRWVVVAKNRGKRPDEYSFKKKRARHKKGEVCVFCEGSEHLTPPEIDRIGDEKNWRVRCFPNKYPATERKKGRSSRGFYSEMPAYGSHEIIVETPQHHGKLAEQSIKRYLEVFEMITRREKALLSEGGMKYVTVFKNQGAEAGASLAHTHMQVVGMPQTPRLIAEEARAVAKKKGCPHCTLAKKEAEGPRLVYENEGALSFTAYAGREPFETWIMPKKHVRGLSGMDDELQEHFADALKNTLKAVNRGIKDPPYNFYLHTSPRSGDLHFHIELAPKTRILAGFEVGYDVYINVMPPEDAARFLRSCI